MRIPKAAHTAQPWRIHAFTEDFRIEDVWSFRAPGAGPDDFPVMIRALKTAYDTRTDPLAVRFLFAVRWKLGALLGWDTPDAGVGGRVATLRDRLPEDLRAGPRGPDLRSAPFTSVFQTHDEWAAEYANKTMHGVMHIGWVPDGAGGYRGQMAVLVKPNGVFGNAYMAAIAPFRHLIVYPALMRQIERDWRRAHARSHRAPEAARPL
jgi:hypothetical protein